MTSKTFVHSRLRNLPTKPRSEKPMAHGRSHTTMGNHQPAKIENC